MSRHTLLSIGLALLSAAALPVMAPALAAAPTGTPQPVAAESRHPDIVFNRVFIFFRTADASLTPLMVKQVTRAAELAKQGGATRIKITGYSDDPKRPGALGQERADALKAQLVKEGIPEAQIETQARTKAPPPSKIGGPNPANHRARISLIRGYASQVGPRDGGR
ncbi:MAG: ompA [Rhodospirillales bacterium]|nr:ompA [Rhodospirillales bacterium]